MLLLLGGALLFALGLSFSVLSKKPISYVQAAERYHYYYSAANDKKVAFTVDDGPHPPVSEEFFTVLEQYDAPATFFYIGEKALLRPDIVREAAERGFDVENHSFTHSHDAHTSYTRLSVELSVTGYLIDQITGERPLFYRPPYLLGIGVDPTINPYLPLPEDMLWALELGYLPIGSDIDPKDWIATSTEEIIARLARELESKPNGRIILLHEDATMAKALPATIEYLHKNGYSIVSLAELLTPPEEISLLGTLWPGDTNEKTNGDVSKLQWFLYGKGYLDPYALSGVFDTQTKAALTEFQIAQGILDPSNPDAAIAGIAEASTRDLIRTLSLKDTIDNAGSVSGRSLWNSATAPVAYGVRTIYITTTPFLREALIGILFLTLILVVARSLGLAGLLLFGRLRRVRVPQVIAINEMPGISVVIPAYNEEENIAATIESVIRCSYPKREIIVIDDGSTDGTAQQVHAVIEAYPQEKVKLIQLENGGKAHAINVALEHSHYDIIAVLDADAAIDPHALQHFAKHFQDSGVGAVAGRVRTTGRGNMLDVFQTLEYAIGQNIDKKAFSALGAVGVVPGPAGAWRKDAVLEMGGFSTDTLVEDQDMTLTLLRAGKKIVYEPLALAYTETPHNVTNFLKQRFRWVYGTMQCFWKHKGAMVEQPTSNMSVVVLPNTFIYNICLPLLYPFADSALIIGLIFGQWETLVLPFLVFTAFDLSYAFLGLWGEPRAGRLLFAVPLQRILYRQLLYYTVMRAVVRAIEGTGSGWNKFRKIGETQRYYVRSLRTPVTVEPVPVSGESLAVPIASLSVSSLAGGPEERS
ncbi:glycosyltransferase [Acetobacteraceae bacterium]|nr:glycosyltransferase [Candidatus Parcubacteria bacterium]